jgi:predicted nucleotidyltransferase
LFEHLFGSKTRVKLLSLFLNNPERPYYVREITRVVDEQINSVRRELSNMLSIGIIKSDSANNKLYYEANQKYQYYPELHKIFSTIPIKSRVAKETREEDQIATKLRTTGSIELAFLTGSFVRQNYLGVDLVVVGDVNRAKVGRVVAEIEKSLGREVNYAIFTSDDFSYRLTLNDRFLANVMDAKRIIVIDAKAVDGSLAAINPDDDWAVSVASELPGKPLFEDEDTV